MSTLTAREINKKFTRFAVCIIVNGNSGAVREYDETFGAVKKIAIAELSASLERAHGRGDHVVKIYGMTLVNTRTAEETRVGFMPQMEWRADGDPLFEL